MYDIYLFVLRLGLTENDLDEVKGIFTDTNLYFLAMTFVIAIVHVSIDALGAI